MFCVNRVIPKIVKCGFLRYLLFPLSVLLCFWLTKLHAAPLDFKLSFGRPTASSVFVGSAENECYKVSRETKPLGEKNDQNELLDTCSEFYEKSPIVSTQLSDAGECTFFLLSDEWQDCMKLVVNENKNELFRLDGSGELKGLSKKSLCCKKKWLIPLKTMADISQDLTLDAFRHKGNNQYQAIYIRDITGKDKTIYSEQVKIRFLMNREKESEPQDGADAYTFPADQKVGIAVKLKLKVTEL